MKKQLAALITLVLITSCTPMDVQPVSVAIPSNTPQANLPNPASVYCEQQGGTPETHTAADGSQSGACVFPDGSECEEWAYYRGECAPSSQGTSTQAPTLEPTSILVLPTEIPTPLPIEPSEYQGWWTYTNSAGSFSIMLPEDWIVEEVTTNDPLMNGHLLNLHPRNTVSQENLRMSFRKTGEEVLLWPTGVGQGEFIQQGTLDVVGEPARRVLLVCPTGEVTAIYYQGTGNQANIIRAEQEFGFIFSVGASHCEAGFSLGGKIQHTGEMIIASLKIL